MNSRQYSYDNLYDFIRKGKSKAERKVENNTTARFDHDNIIVRLHDTDIAELFPDKTIILSSGGYQTMTTKDRLNKIIPEGFNLYQQFGLWFLSDYQNDKVYPFCDGIMILPDRTVTGYDTEYQSKITLRKDIKKYAKGFMNALINGKVDKPYAGDCMYCFMREVNTNKPWGETSSNTDHLQSHFDEKYYVGSLFYRAVELYPMSIIANSAMYELWEKDTKPDEWLSDILAEQGYKSLLKYLYQQFNLPY